MHPMGMPCIYTWIVATLVAIVSAVVFLIRLVTKKNRKIVKRVFWISNAVAVGAFVLYGITSPITRCDHDFTVVVDLPATCTVDGRTEQYCPLCDFTKKETIKSTGHNMATESKREPTYEADGEVVERCTICGYEVITKIDMLVRETKPVETKPIETKPIDTKPVETKPVETEPIEKTKTDRPQKSQYCVVCRGNAQYSYTNPFSGVEEPYCYTHYKEIKDTLQMMEDDVNESSHSRQGSDTNSYSGSSARHTDSEAFSCAKAIVKSILKSPSTAKFCRITDAAITHLGNGEYMVTGWVEAQNSFGATLRQDFVVVYTATENGYKNADATLY